MGFCEVDADRNILMITADQFRHDCLGAVGNPLIQTPNLDALAGEGVLFRRHFAQACPCGPSRMCLCTGRYMCSTRSVNNMTPLTEAEDNVAWWLREAGFGPALLGYNDYAVDPRICAPGDPRKTGLDYDNFLPGFEVVLDHEQHSAEYFEYLRRQGYPADRCNSEIVSTPDVPPEGAGGHLPCHFPARYRAEDSEGRFVANRTIDYLRQPHAKPWFVSVNFVQPHPPHICAAPFHAMYDPQAMPAAVRRPEELEDAHPYLERMKRKRALLDDEHLREMQACYYGKISELDASLGLLFDALRETRAWDNTLIIFTSDYGEYLGDHHFFDKAHFYDQTMRVPCIIRDPSPEADAARGTQLDCFSESVDIVPTVLDWAGVDVPDRVQGQSLLGHVRGAADAPAKREIHFEYDFRSKDREFADLDPYECVLWVLRDDAYKYVQFGVESMPPLLFDVENDPREFCDLAGEAEYAPIVAEYCQRMLRWRMKNEDQRMEHWAYQYR